MSAHHSVEVSNHLTDREIADVMERRQQIRYFAATLSAATAIVYFLIGFHVIAVLDGNANQIWGLPAGAAYAFGAFLLLGTDRRLFWALGAVLQIFVILTYFDVASERTPVFEIWGVLIKIVQLMLLVSLVYLMSRSPFAPPTSRRE